MKRYLAFFSLVCFALLGCVGQRNQKSSVEIIGNKGARGLMPENTIESMIKAIELGSRAIKLEVVISKDRQVVVSQEPYFSHRISTPPNGQPITLENEKSFNIYQMTADSLINYDVGLKFNPDFPNQEKFRVAKPLLHELIKQLEFYTKRRKIKGLRYFIEPKSIKDGDNLFQPKTALFVDYVMKVVKEQNIETKTVLYSFDINALQYAKKNYPNLQLAYAVDDKIEFDDYINRLGFNPNFYSAYFPLVGKTLVDLCHLKNIRILVWNVNKPNEYTILKNMGVDGILTDYPNLFISIPKK